MLKSLVFGSLSVLVLGHPRNEDLINDIKNKTNLWKPYEANENPLNHMNHEQLLSLLGT
jgi:hypothetical protein